MNVLVTGAGGGIGSAIVRLARRRGHVVLAHEKNTFEAGAFDGDPHVKTAVGDLTAPNTLAELGRVADSLDIDAAVLAHGIEGAGGLHELTPSECARF